MVGAGVGAIVGRGDGKGVGEMVGAMVGAGVGAWKSVEKLVVDNNSLKCTTGVINISIIRNDVHAFLKISTPPLSMEARGRDEKKMHFHCEIP